MMTMNNNFLNNLLNSISVSGYEEQVQDIVEEEMKDYVDEVRRDEMQNVTCVINPNSNFVTFKFFLLILVSLSD